MANPNTPLAEQLKIVFFGLRNAGKSSLMNHFMGLEASIVSDTPGTTTDPVTRSFELGELGPVAVVDTAGLDDVGELGQLRIKKSQERIQLSDIPVFVTRCDTPLTDLERRTVEELKEKKPGLCVVLTHGDLDPHPEKKSWAGSYGAVTVDNLNRLGMEEFRKHLIKNAAKIEHEISPLEGLVNENDFIILVTPIDLAAPKGRLIMPQVETIRDVLDKDCACLVVKERELKFFYDSLTIKPKLVVCDSQAFSKVAADIPDDQLLTSFSILFARKKGDLSVYTEGAKALAGVQPGGKVLILESCAHHKQADDIGTVKIPRLYQQLVQSKTEFIFARELPPEEELAQLSMVINCAGCMVSRNKIMNRVDVLKKLKIPVLNYGLFLAWVNGLLPRALEPFPEEFSLFSRKTP